MVELYSFKPYTIGYICDLCHRISQVLVTQIALFIDSSVDFYRRTPGATEFSARATTDKHCVSVNTNGYNVRVVCSLLLSRLGLPVAGNKSNTPDM